MSGDIWAWEIWRRHGKCWRNDLKQNCELDLWSIEIYEVLKFNIDMSGSELKIFGENINVEGMIKN